MRVKNNMLVMVLTLLMTFAGATPSHAAETVRVAAYFSEQLAKGCLAAIQAKVPGLTLEARPIDAIHDKSDGLNALTAGDVDVLWREPQSKSRLTAATRPFLYRDLEHFIAFSFSDTFREIADADARTHGLRALGLVYDKQTFQFSRKAPLTEPGHYRGATIASLCCLWWAKLLGARVLNELIDYRSEELVDLFTRGAVDAVENMLDDAVKQEVHRAAKYVSPSASLLAEAIYVSEPAWHRWSPARKALVVRMAEEAVTTCSARAFDREAQLFRQVTAAGARPVPVNRAAFVAALKPHLKVDGWRLEDLAAIEKIGPMQAAPARLVPVATDDIPAVKWRVQTSYPARLRVYDDLVRELATSVGELSGGRIQLEVLPAGAIVPVIALLEAVGRGHVTLGWASPATFAAKDPAFGLIGSIPFGPDAAGYTVWRNRPDIRRIVDDLYARFGVKGLSCGVTNSVTDLWSAKPLTAASDLKALRVSPRFWGPIFARAGASPVTLPAGELVPAMERRMVDAAVGYGAAVDEGFGLPDVARFNYYPGVLAPAYGIDLIVQKSAWDAIGGRGQQVVEQACVGMQKKAMASTDQADAQALARFRGAGIAVQPLPQPIKALLRQGWEAHAAETALRSPAFAELLRSLSGVTP
ncbi:MAG: hypothetical protein HYU41_23300 [Candidatus Rokubacteria bacterium]|nr:hypothetical protein [Candidatus Rokubacteria bacterium]